MLSNYFQMGYSTSKGLLFALILLIYSSCKKQDEFLNTKPNAALSTISNLADCRYLINNEAVFNQDYASLTEIQTDDHYVNKDGYLSAGSYAEQKAFIFSDDLYSAGYTPPDWASNYVRVYYANLILEALEKIDRSELNGEEYDDIKGAALFFRSYSFYDLLQTFSMPYDSMVAAKQLGIPLRLNSDINIKSTRASEKDCYKQISDDLKKAEALLPDVTLIRTHPSKNAARGLRARINFELGYYAEALDASNSVLNNNQGLVDYNTLDFNNDFYLCNNSDLYPLKEELIHTVLSGYTLNGYSRSIVDTSLFNSYNDNDLRKKAFFSTYNGAIRFKGSYEFSQGGLLFSGVAMDEIYLIRAECYVRMGALQQGLDDLNELLLKRYVRGTFTPYSMLDEDSAINLIIKERRKELLYRGIRWSELRRINREPSRSVIVTHVLDNIPYKLNPNDLRYALPIPIDEIKISGIQPNPR